jgi:kynurenine formamidase
MTSAKGAGRIPTEALMRRGLENVANLGQVPPMGATIVVGSPKVAGCTGGPSRVFALVS